MRNADATLDALRSFPDQLEAHFLAVPSGYRQWAPPSWDGVPSEALTAIEQLCHVRDIEIDGYQDRFRRTLHESNPTLPSIDTDALVVQRAYAAADAADVLASFREAHRATVELLEQLAPEQFERTAEFEGYGSVSLRGLVHYLCSHDQQHLAGLQWLLGKIEGALAAGRPR
jgi:hypothetical protein